MTAHSMRFFRQLLCLLLLLPITSGCKTTVFILPLLLKEQDCYRLHDNNKYDCRPYIDWIITQCSRGNFRREQGVIFFPPFNNPFICSFVGQSRCRPFEYYDNYQLALIPNRNNRAKKKLNNYIKTETQQCVNNSMALILTNIPCSSYAHYPDVQQLFSDQNLASTIEWLESIRLHTIVYYLGDRAHSPKPCNLIASRNWTEYLQLDQITYQQSINEPYNKICNKTYPIETHSVGLTDGAKVGISIAGGLCIALMMGIIVFLGRRIYRRYHESKMEWFAEQHALQVRHLLFGRTRKLDEWEITPKDMKVETDYVIGSGASAAVYKGVLKREQDDGTVQRVEVAAKFSHSYASRISKKAMLREIELMKTFEPHPNVVKFYGCVSTPQQPAVVTEFCSNGDLLKHLRAHELHYMSDDRCDEVEVCLLLPNLLRIASEVCSAMIHLSSLGLVHRDLAARNVFLTDDLTAKVGDFGLCRKAGGILTIEDKEEKLPVTHMPFEALKSGDFSEKSDVWSFGCLLFEMFSEGQRPFFDIDVGLLLNYLEEDRQPQFSEDTPSEIIQLAHRICFIKEKEERGTNEKLTLNDKLQHHMETQGFNFKDPEFKMRRYFCIFLTFALQVCGPIVFEKFLYGSFISIYFGNPKQELLATFSFELSNIIFLDKNCGLRPNCLQYCNDVAFAVMYCEPVCQFKYSTKIFVCNSEPIRDALRRLPYSLTDSKTFNLLARDFWNSQTWFTDTLSGKFFIDRLGFVADDTNSTGNVEIQHALMIDGTFLDVNLFTEVGALVGFGPGENNIVQQLYAQKAIPSPVLLYNSFMSVIKIGDITDNTCGIWSEHDTRDKNRWVLELEKVELNGVRYEKKIKALITNHIKNISLPLNFMNELVGANVLKTFNDIESLIHDSDFYFDCNWPLKLRITVDSRRLTIPNSLLKQSKINDTHCLPYINQIGSLRYSNDVDLILGWPFLKRFCIGFDYGKRIIRLAEHS